MPGERGRITAAAIADEIALLDDYAVMLCGQLSFVKDMTRQFQALGIPRERIITEEFASQTDRPIEAGKSFILNR
ncbi:MAG: hypothetical protein HC808_14785 [Candidatus Competibacteraceae bacterium]|nr:hypothetical protein [Candidatus Competibacteraceae bacterium]